MQPGAPEAVGSEGTMGRLARVSGSAACEPVSALEDTTQAAARDWLLSVGLASWVIGIGEKPSLATT